jgi:diacylglycerol kinase (ATP)
MRTLAKRHDIEAIWPQSAEHSHVAAREAALSGTSLVIAMGGDGVVHHVAQGLIGTPSTLGIIPSGTTNVLARLVGIPNRATAATKLLAGDFATFASPTVAVTGSGPDGSWSATAVFSLGVGPDALVVAAAESEPFRKYRFGGVHYARTAIGVVRKDIRKRKADVIIATPTERNGIGAMIQFHSSYTYFGRFALRFDNDVPDPMSVLTIERLPMRRTLKILRKASTGSLEEVKGLFVDRRVSEVTVDSPGVEVQMDGEHYGVVTSLTAVARPEGLRVAVPHSPR